MNQTGSIGSHLSEHYGGGNDALCTMICRRAESKAGGTRGSPHQQWKGFILLDAEGYTKSMVGKPQHGDF